MSLFASIFLYTMIYRIFKSAAIGKFWSDTERHSQASSLYVIITAPRDLRQSCEIRQWNKRFKRR